MKQHSQEMEEEVMKKHIELYVNQFSINLGKEGRNAIEKFMQIYRETRQKADSALLSDTTLFVEEE